MCGISGVVIRNSSQISDQILDNVAKRMKHRGPDNVGIHRFENIALVHTRLSIIDLSDDGNQPYHFNEFSIIFNGEVYNFLALKEKLLAQGIVFQTSSDVEVIIKYLAIMGLDSVKDFNGMFAIALFDHKKRIMHLIRDRVGVKPLFYSNKNGNLYFASEQNVFYAYPEFSWQLDTFALSEYLLFQNIVSFKTFDESIIEVMPGSIMSYQIDSPIDQIRVKKYFKLEICTDESMIDEMEGTKILTNLLERAVESQLLSDVEVGCYLSGGLDSGSIVAQVHSFNAAVRTFTVGFKNLDGTAIAPFDETEAVIELAESLRINSLWDFVTPNNFESVMYSAFKALSEPRVGQSYPNHVAAVLASENVRVVLSGTGGDELFAGYPWRYSAAFKNRNFRDFREEYFGFWCRLFDFESVAKIRMHGGREGAIYARDKFMELVQPVEYGTNSHEKFLNSALEFEIKTFLRGLLLVEDQISMANSLETRVPLLDNEILDFALRSPVSWKYDNDEKKGKVILAKAMSSLLPPVHIERSKRGFTGPDEIWFRSSSKNLVENRLLDKQNHIFDVLNYAPIVEKVNKHLAGKENNRLLIWSLFNLEFYLSSHL